jgi:PAS domain S-box-containing protein
MDRLSYQSKLTATFIAFAVFLLTIAVWLFFEMVKTKQIDDAISNAQHISVQKKEIFNRYISQYDNILFAIESSNVFNKFLESSSKEATQNAEELFSTFANSNTNITQLRYIDKNGQERIRVERSKKGDAPFIVPKEMLQDKKKRYYFTEISSLKKGEVWYSQIDLNIERSMLEKPLKPVIRVGIPVIKNGIKHGVLIVNIFMKEFLESFVSSAIYDIYLVYSDNNILVSTDHQNDWNKYFGNSSGIKELIDEKRFFLDEISFRFNESLKIYFFPKESATYTTFEERKKRILTIVFFIVLLSIPLAYFFARHPARLEKKLAQYNEYLTEKIEDVKKQEELLRSIINATDDMIFFKDINYIYMGCNNAYEKWMGIPKEKIIGKSDSELYKADIAVKNLDFDKHVMRENKTIQADQSFINESGQNITFQVKKSPFYDSNGNIIGLVGVARNITNIKDMEDKLRNLNSTLERRVDEKTIELQKSNKKLERNVVDLNYLNSKLIVAKEEAMQAAQARSNFISSVSHELRTPLNSIINFTDQVIEDFEEMLHDKELQEDTLNYLDRVMVNSRHLLELINDLLEFTKAEAGKIEYNMQEIDINTRLLNAYDNTKSLLNGTDIEFKLVLCDEPLMVNIDPRRFLQIILNLLSNAIKFTKKGHVIIRCYKSAYDVIVEVEDTGKGIPESRQKDIFEPFVQAKNTDTGTGLGLGLAQRMCQDMGIDISFESAEGKGTTFKLRLKLVD